MAESEEALQLKRRARRRLVGAIALVTFVVIILPLILDKEPGPAGPPLSVQIPNQESTGFNTRVVPPAPVSVAPAPEKTAEIPAVKAGPSPAKAAGPVSKAEPPVADAAAKAPAQPALKTEAGRVQAALNDQFWAVTLDAFADVKNAKQLRAKLSAAGIKSYTEPVKTSKGELTRVRAGPFASKEAAENARAKLIALGLKPGAVVSK
ncbi:MAG: SPOR domain-containing protein [Pseudomonadota bacterium]